MRISPFRPAGTTQAAKKEGKGQIQRSAQAAVESAMTDGFVESIQRHARQDARTGDYMGPDFHLLEKSHMRRFISPDRAGPMGQVSARLQELAKEKDPLLELLDQLLGNCTAKVRHDPMGQSAEVRAPNGEVIASYSGSNGGWTEIQTTAEKKFMSEVAAVYYKAFQEARAEQKAAQAPAPEAGTTVDVLA